MLSGTPASLVQVRGGVIGRRLNQVDRFPPQNLSNQTADALAIG
jgi:hypothetical protein